MFSLPLPPFVAFVALSGERDGVQGLHPRELEAQQAFQSSKRRLEFGLGRTAARMALAKLGLYDAPALLSGEDGEPLWPAGFVGSLSHAGNCAAAAVAPREELGSLGIDLQPLDRPMRFDLSTKIAAGEEQEWINQEPSDKARRALVMFSAKESVYKAYFPLCRRFIGFTDVTLSWNEAKQGFDGVFNESVHLPVTAPRAFFVAVYTHGQMAVTSVLVRKTAAENA